jgi:hypothetical protein
VPPVRDPHGGRQQSQGLSGASAARVVLTSCSNLLQSLVRLFAIVLTGAWKMH